MKRFNDWLDHHRNFPSKFNKYILRDILNYSDEEIKNLGLMDFNLALQYAVETYVRRDVYFIMNSIYSDKKKTKKGTKKLVIEHPEIEEWVKQQYENDEVE